MNYAIILSSKISKSVKDRMISDTPVGAFLSGGVDSSAIVVYMRKYSDQKIKTFQLILKIRKTIMKICILKKFQNVSN